MNDQKKTVSNYKPYGSCAEFNNFRDWGREFWEFLAPRFTKPLGDKRWFSTRLHVSLSEKPRIVRELDPAASPKVACKTLSVGKATFVLESATMPKSIYSRTRLRAPIRHLDNLYLESHTSQVVAAVSILVQFAPYFVSLYVDLLRQTVNVSLIGPRVVATATFILNPPPLACHLEAIV